MTHPHPALAAIAAALALAAAPSHARAQQQPAPAVTVSPDPVVSVAPSPAPVMEATPEPSAAPLDEATPAPKAPSRLVGTLMSVKGTIATVKMANGAVQTYTVSAKTAALLKKSLGKKLAFRVLRGALDVLPH